MPSESEWEYACRGGTITRYYFGDTITVDLVNHRSNYAQTTDVGRFYPNAFGLYDMHGNVHEWCEDCWHGNYRKAPKDGSVWISTDVFRLLRGGSWYNIPNYCRSAYRHSENPNQSDRNSGFRLVVSGAGTL